MYENNYNYVEVPGEGKDKKKDNKVGRTVAMLLAVAIVGGASGFGGAYLQNSIASDNQPAASASSAKTAFGETQNALLPKITAAKNIAIFCFKPYYSLFCQTVDRCLCM